MPSLPRGRSLSTGYKRARMTILQSTSARPKHHHSEFIPFQSFTKFDDPFHSALPKAGCRCHVLQCPNLDRLGYRSWMPLSKRALRHPADFTRLTALSVPTLRLTVGLFGLGQGERSKNRRPLGRYKVDVIRHLTQMKENNCLYFYCFCSPCDSNTSVLRLGQRLYLPPAPYQPPSY